jgi:hypothetical protein
MKQLLPSTYDFPKSSYDTSEVITINFVTLRELAEVINCAKYGFDCLRGFSPQTSKNCPFSLIACIAYITTGRHHAPMHKAIKLLQCSCLQYSQQFLPKEQKLSKCCTST